MGGSKVLVWLILVLVSLKECAVPLGKIKVFLPLLLQLLLLLLLFLKLFQIDRMLTRLLLMLVQGPSRSFCLRRKGRRCGSQTSFIVLVLLL